MTKPEDYKLEELIDIPLFRSFLERLNDISPFASAIMDNEGRFLVSVGWLEICLKYHRVHPKCAKACIASDQYIFSHLKEADPAITYKCQNGFIDSATPIIIDGKHVGTVFIGQFFVKKPDLEVFRVQARKYGFDEEEYLRLIANVPVWSEKTMLQCQQMVKSFTEIIVGIGYRQLREKEARRLADERENDFNQERSLVGKIMDISPVSVIFVDAAGKVTYTNRRCEEIFGLSKLGMEKRNYYNPSWGVYTLDGVPYPAEDLPYAVVKRTGRPVSNVELKEKMPDGGFLELSVSAAPLLSGTGDFMGMVSIVEDISGRRKREAEVRASLAEKEVLLKEIHHRVKNNLQVVSSLLNLQARNFTDPLVLEAFRESRGRIKAMALVHEALYRSPDFTGIDFRKYFSMLVHSLFSTYNSTGQVSFSNQICECSLNVDTASALGLILNELISNSLKHAFKDERRGTLRVALFREKDGYCLEVQDDGPGLSAGFDLNNTHTLGMQLLASLTSQISGTVRVLPAKGAHFIVSFPG